MRPILALLLILIPPAVEARTLHVGSKLDYQAPSRAIAAADDGDTIAIAPGTYIDCAVVTADRITIEGTGTPGKVVLANRTCRGKGILVIEGRDTTVRNLTLARARVRDGNGAGIRAEGENLTIDHVQFFDDQDGILSNPSPNSRIVVKDSAFLRDGVCLDACAHAIYAGRIALLRVVSSRFEEIHEGHAVKSRAARTEILGNDIADGPQGTSSYLVEAPNGGDVIVRFNVFEKGPRTGNTSAAISIGAEGVDQPTPEIVVENNTLANDTGQRTALLVNHSSTAPRMAGNRTTGPVDLLVNAPPPN